MVVVALLIVIWAAVLVPPAVRSQNARRKAFEISFGRGISPAVPPAPEPARPNSSVVQRRRRIAGGLLLAIATTGIGGLLPAFRSLLVVHLFLDDSFLFYVALLAYRAERRAKALASTPASTSTADLETATPPRRRRVARPVLVADLPPVVRAS